MSSLAKRISEFSVFDWTARPTPAIFLREWLVALRYGRFALLLAGISGVLLVAIAVNLARASSVSMPNVVMNIVGLQCGAVMLLLYIVIPALSAVSIAAERLQGTHDLIRMALRDPRALLVGKAMAMLALFSAFHCALLPFSVFTFFFAGIEVKSFFQITLMLYGTALCHSIVGVTISSMLPRPNRAIFVTYAVLAAIYLLPMGLGGPLQYTATSTFTATTLFDRSPLNLLLELLHGVAGWWECFHFFAIQLTATLITLLLCGFIHRLTPRLPQHLSSPEANTANGVRRPSYGPMVDWLYPAYQKDCRTSYLTRPLWTLTTCLSGCIAAVAFTFLSAHYHQLRVTAPEAGTLLLLLLTPLLVLERASRDMDPINLLMLRITALSAHEVLLGKALATARCLLPLCMGIVLGSLLALLGGNIATWTGGHPTTPSTDYLVYQAALLPLKLFVAVALCFACIRYRAPSAIDIALALMLSCMLLAFSEILREGLFEPSSVNALSQTDLLILYTAQFIAAAFGSTLLFVVALMRFETVFDEGIDTVTAPSINRSAY